MTDQIDYDLQRKLIEINERYERGELDRSQWLAEREAVGGKAPTWREEGDDS